MPRPRKCRKVCCMPRTTHFAPVGSAPSDPTYRASDEIVLAVDEYESIRLIDHEGFTQEECAGYMNIARTTVQQIYNDARRKLSVALVESRPLVISGGEYRLCDGSEAHCGCGGCCRHRSDG